eukprot:3835759-Pleurochrysis_carterae.AAC.2
MATLAEADENSGCLRMMRSTAVQKQCKRFVKEEVARFAGPPDGHALHIASSRRGSKGCRGKKSAARSGAC